MSRSDVATAAEINDRQIVATGTPESEWKAWPELHALPALEAATLVPEGRHLVVIAPHPDDEVLGAGALLAQLATRRAIRIVAVTDGGASHPGSRLWPRRRLIEARRRERAAGLRKLGIRRCAIRLGFDDNAVAAEGDRLLASLVRHLCADDVVLAPWRLDGHPDHEACGRAAAAACRLRGATLIEMPIWMWHWARPADSRVPWASAVRVDARDGGARKAAAIACHHTQIQADPSTAAAAILPDWALARWLRPFEVFFIETASR